jgi:hypothetical protein
VPTGALTAKDIHVYAGGPAGAGAFVVADFTSKLLISLLAHILLLLAPLLSILLVISGLLTVNLTPLLMGSMLVLRRKKYIYLRCRNVFGL